MPDPTPTAAPLEQMKAMAKTSVEEAGRAAEEFRADFKAFLSQILVPETWKEGVKLVVNGGMGLLKDLQEMLTEKNWSPDKMVLRMNTTLEGIVQRHPELDGEWQKVQVSFKFAKMKTDEALAQIKAAAEREFGKFDESKVVSAVWGGVKGELKKDFSDLAERLGLKKKSNE